MPVYKSKVKNISACTRPLNSTEKVNPEQATDPNIHHPACGWYEPKMRICYQNETVSPSVPEVYQVCRNPEPQVCKEGWDGFFSEEYCSRMFKKIHDFSLRLAVPLYDYEISRLF